MLKFICALFIFLNFGVLKCQTWQWAFSTNELTNTQTVIDSSNNVYVAGYFHGDSCLFNGTYIIGEQNCNFLLAKLSPVGTTLWTKVCSSSSINNAGILEYKGEVILGVNFSGNMSGFINDSSSTQKYFIAKVNATGNLTYYKKEGAATLISMDLTPNGSILANGVYNQSTTISGVTLTGNANINSGFFLRYNNNGSLSLIKNLVWKDYQHSLGIIHADSVGNIYLSVAFSEDSLIIDNDTIVYFNSTTYQYARELLRFDYFGKLKKLDITSIYFSYMVEYRAFGNADYTVRLVSTACNRCSSGLSISRVNSQNISTWSYSYGRGFNSGAPNEPPPPFMYPRAISGDNNKIYFTAVYSAKQAIGGDTIYNSGMVLAKMDHAGVYEKVVSAEYAMSPTNLSNVKNNAIIISGDNGSGGFLGVHQLNSLGQKGGFIAKWSEPVPVLVKENLKQSPLFSIYPNPSKDIFTLKIPGQKSCSVKVLNLLGQSIRCLQSDLSNDLSVDLTGKPKGIYFVHVNIGNTSEVKKIILE